MTTLTSATKALTSGMMSALALAYGTDSVTGMFATCERECATCTVKCGGAQCTCTSFSSGSECNGGAGCSFNCGGNEGSMCCADVCGS